MTVTATPAPDAPPRERWLRTPAGQVTVRWLLVLGATMFAFWQTLAAVVDEMFAQTIIGYLPATLLLLVIAAIGTSWRRGDELPIRDRQTDVIVGLVILIVAITFKVMNLRYPDVYLTTHVDLLAVWCFVLGSACLVFGLRPVARYRWTWLLGLMIFPVPYRLEALLLGGGPFVAGLVMVVFGATASAVATGRTLRRGLRGAAITGSVGLIGLVVVRVFFTDAPLWVYQTAPAVSAALVASGWLYVQFRAGHGQYWTPLGQPLLPPSVPRVGRPRAVIIAFAIVMAFIPIPAFDDTPNTTVPGLDVTPPVTVPDGWVGGEVVTYDWVTRLYGRNSIMATQDLLQVEGSLRFDKFARPRKVVANTIETRLPIRFDVYPVIFIYDLVGDRFSQRLPIELSHGITAELQTVVDDDSYLTFTRLTWEWNNGERTQSVNLFAVDNHDPDVAFPVPAMTVARNVNTFITVAFRGGSVITDLEPQFKDRDLLVECAEGIIAAQLARSAVSGGE